MVTIRPKAEGWISVVISDAKHKEVRTLFDGMIRPGEYTYAWNRKDDKGKRLPSGRYFCRMKYRDIQMQTMIAVQVP
jgi:flagellar hook assembly protein FlgD